MADDREILFREVDGIPSERVQVILLRKWARTPQMVQEEINKEELLGCLVYQGRKWCADAGLVEKLREFLVEGDCWASLEEAKRQIQSNALVVYPQ